MLVVKRLTIGKKLKQLKKRLKELERRETTLDDASSCGNEKPSPSTNTKPTQAFKGQSQSPPSLVVPVLQGQYTPPMHDDDEYLFPAACDERERSHTPPTFAYPTYPPPPEHMIMPPYGAVEEYHPMPTEIYPEYLSLAPVWVSLPLMTYFSDAIKQETGYPGSGPVDEGLPPYMS
jgi:hypothetical protein